MTRPVDVVTGAGGFIGRHLCRRLLADGRTVRGIDLHPIASSHPEPGFEFFRTDIRDTTAVEEILAGAERVFHLASAHLQVNAPSDWYQTINVDAARSLVSACADRGVERVVHVSSVGIYGHVIDPPADEDSPKHPTNEYERTKLLGEAAVLEAAERSGVDLVVVRPSWVYGPGCPRTEKLLRTIRARRFVFVGAGDNLRHPIFVDDCIEGLLAAAAAPRAAAGHPYLIVGEEAVTVEQLVETAAAALGVPAPRRHLPRPLMSGVASAVEVGFGILRRQPPISRRSLAFFENDNAFDGRAAERELGFLPRVSLTQGLERTVTELWPREREVLA